MQVPTYEAPTSIINEHPLTSGITWWKNPLPTTFANTDMLEAPTPSLVLIWRKPLLPDWQTTTFPEGTNLQITIVDHISYIFKLDPLSFSLLNHNNIKILLCNINNQLSSTTHSHCQTLAQQLNVTLTDNNIHFIYLEIISNPSNKALTSFWLAAYSNFKPTQPYSQYKGIVWNNTST